MLDAGRFGYADVLVTLFPGVDVPNGAQLARVGRGPVPDVAVRGR